jgi:hypothetical protein
VGALFRGGRSLSARLLPLRERECRESHSGRRGLGLAANVAFALNVTVRRASCRP